MAGNTLIVKDEHDRFMEKMARKRQAQLKKLRKEVAAFAPLEIKEIEVEQKLCLEHKNATPFGYTFTFIVFKSLESGEFDVFKSHKFGKGLKAMNAANEALNEHTEMINKYSTLHQVLVGKWVDDHFDYLFEDEEFDQNCSYVVICTRVEVFLKVCNGAFYLLQRYLCHWKPSIFVTRVFMEKFGLNFDWEVNHTEEKFLRRFSEWRKLHVYMDGFALPKSSLRMEWFYEAYKTIPESKRFFLYFYFQSSDLVFPLNEPIGKENLCLYNFSCRCSYKEVIELVNVKCVVKYGEMTVGRKIIAASDNPKADEVAFELANGESFDIKTLKMKSHEISNGIPKITFTADLCRHVPGKCYYHFVYKQQTLSLLASPNLAFLDVHEELATRLFINDYGVSKCYIHSIERGQIITRHARDLKLRPNASYEIEIYEDDVVANRT